MAQDKEPYGINVIQHKNKSTTNSSDRKDNESKMNRKIVSFF
jgi:hypothetical protein